MREGEREREREREREKEREREIHSAICNMEFQDSWCYSSRATVS
jgi:hypothetical protein